MYHPVELVDDSDATPEFVFEYGELGRIVLEAFNAADPLHRHLDNDIDYGYSFTYEYLGEARGFIEELRAAADAFRRLPNDALIASLIRRSLDDTSSYSVGVMARQLYPELIRLALKRVI
jgi:hypothetical protein